MNSLADINEWQYLEVSLEFDSVQPCEKTMKIK